MNFQVNRKKINLLESIDRIDKLTLFGGTFKDNWYYIHPNHPIYFNYTKMERIRIKISERVNSEIPINKYKDDDKILKVSNNQDTNYKKYIDTSIDAIDVEHKALESILMNKFLKDESGTSGQYW